jgi:hypothetical protein
VGHLKRGELGVGGVLEEGTGVYLQCKICKEVILGEGSGLLEGKDSEGR